MRARSHALWIGLLVVFGTVGIPYAFACTPFTPVPMIAARPPTAIVNTTGSATFADESGLALSLSMNGSPIVPGSDISLPTGMPVTFSYRYRNREGYVSNFFIPMDLLEYPLNGFDGAVQYQKAYLELWPGVPMSSEDTLAPIARVDISGKASGTASFTIPASGTYTVVILMSYSSIDPASVCAIFGYCPLDANKGPQTYDHLISTLPDITCAFDELPPLAMGGVTFSAVSKPAASSVLFVPGTEGSRLYYRTRLGFERQVWEPNVRGDMGYLAMNPDGTSVYPLYTKDIIDSLEAHSLLETEIEKVFTKNDLDAYGGFETFMNGLVANGTIPAWQAFPYDWRYSPLSVAKDGTETEEANGTLERVYLADVVKQMASASPSGKVTLIAHSNGGLVVKALLDTYPNLVPLVDHVVFISVPQWGTPMAIGALLHADTFADLSGFVMNHAEARVVTDEVPDAYDLLPTETYFSRIQTPVVTFSNVLDPSRAFAAAYGSTISSSGTLNDFLEDSAKLDAALGTDLRAPVPLPEARIAEAAKDHQTLDAPLPSGVALTAVAGWGNATPVTVKYDTGYSPGCLDSALFSKILHCGAIPYLAHTVSTTQDGDGTVVSPSAIGTEGQGLYFNITRFTDDGNKNYKHQNILSALPIQQIITDIVSSKDPSTERYVSTTKPTGGANPILQISSHSPVNLIVTDSAGNQSGVVPIPGSDFSLKKQDIMDSSVFALDDEEYVNVPLASSYSVSAQGYAEGNATLAVTTLDAAGMVTASTTFADIPVTASTTISFSVASATPSAPLVDENGDGSIDFAIASVSPDVDPLAYARYIGTVARAFALPQSVTGSFFAQLAVVEKELQKREDHRGEAPHGPASKIAKENDLIRLHLELLKKMVMKKTEPEPSHEQSKAHKGAFSLLQAGLLFDMIDRLENLL